MHCVLLILGLLLVWVVAPSADSRLEAMARAAATPGPLVLRPAVVIRQASVLTGPISIASASQVGSGSVPRFGRFELTVTFAALAGTRPYSTDLTASGIRLDATFTDPDRVMVTVPGFFDGATWAVRFAPNQVGQWSWSVRASDSSGFAEHPGGTFTCEGNAGGAATHGWVRNDGRWFRHVDGTPFCPVGHNTGWQDNVEQPSLSLLAADALPGSAPRLLSFWLNAPWKTLTDTPNRAQIEQAGTGLSDWTYNQAACSYIDGVVNRADEAGVFLLPSIWTHDQLRVPGRPWSGGSWSNNPYRLVVDDAADFFKIDNGSGGPTAQWKLQQDLLRYIIARWGSRPAIAGWVALVEINGSTGSEKPSQAAVWATAVDAWFVAHDPYRSRLGKVPVMTSVSHGSSGEVPLFDPVGQLGVRATDSYSAKTDEIGIAAVIAEMTLALHAADKPFVHTEFGGEAPATQPLHLHNGMWASFASGASIPALVWCDDGSYPMLTQPMRSHLAYLAKFIGPLSWLADSSQETAAATIQVRTDIEGWYRSIADRGAIWLHRRTLAASITGTTTSVAVANGRYAVWWTDTWTGAETQSADITVIGGSLDLVVPGSANADIAATWQRYPSLTALTSSTPAGGRRALTLASGYATVRVTSLPNHGGRLWQTVDGVTTGDEIIGVPTVLTDPLHRVIYEAPVLVGPESFGYAVIDGRIPYSFTANVTVTMPAPGSGVVPVQKIDGAGCGAGGVAGLGLITLLALRRRRR